MQLSTRHISTPGRIQPQLPLPSLLVLSLLAQVTALLRITKKISLPVKSMTQPKIRAPSARPKMVKNFGSAKSMPVSRLSPNPVTSFPYVVTATWNPKQFAPNATNYIEIHNANSTSSANSKIDKTEEVHNLQGYINIYMLEKHLLGHAGNDTDSAANLTFHLISTPVCGEPNTTIGPIISLTYDPDSLPKIRIPDAIPKKLGFQIGLPVALVALIVIGLSICCAIRKNKEKWREVRHHGSDYVKNRARKRRAAKGQSIELNDYDFDSSTARAERFEDEPTRGGNAFRDEIERQKQEEWRNRPQKITSF